MGLCKGAFGHAPSFRQKRIKIHNKNEFSANFFEILGVKAQAVANPKLR